MAVLSLSLSPVVRASDVEELLRCTMTVVPTMILSSSVLTNANNSDQKNESETCHYRSSLSNSSTPWNASCLCPYDRLVLTHSNATSSKIVDRWGRLFGQFLRRCSMAIDICCFQPTSINLNDNLWSRNTVANLNQNIRHSHHDRRPCVVVGGLADVFAVSHSLPLIGDSYLSVVHNAQQGRQRMASSPLDIDSPGLA